jgi:photoactive yellow protein
LDEVSTIAFEQADLQPTLDAASADELDALSFGVIHFDADWVVQRYNRYEQVNTGLRQERVLGMEVFTQLAQCMNNFMVAEKFVAAKAAAFALDETIDYVLTWKMKPTQVKLRMLCRPSVAGGYVLLKRLP